MLKITRLERVALRSSTSQAKIMGTIASISGALLVVLYKGPQVFSSPSPSSTLLQPSYSNWVIGGILLAVAYLLFSIRYIIQVNHTSLSTPLQCWKLSNKLNWTWDFGISQTQVMEIYPAELLVALFYNICGAIISAPVSLIAESELSSWMLRPSVAVIAVLYSVRSQNYNLVAVYDIYLDMDRHVKTLWKLFKIV